jgi:Raf kinase inhibitor-like YbhB/YbcL family protein
VLERVRGSYVVLAAVCLLVAAVLPGCGEGSTRSASSSSTVAPSSPVSTGASPSAVDAVALVAGSPIAKSTYEHWLSVEQALGVGGSPSHRALGFLITSAWVLAEATARGVSVSDAEVEKHLHGLERQSFSKPGSLASFLERSRQTEADLLGRARIELLQSRIVGQVTAGKSASASQGVLASFQRTFQERWKRRTTCKPAYVMEDCSEDKNPSTRPEARAAKGPAPSPGSSSSSSGSKAASSAPSSSSSSSSSSSTASPSGEEYPSPGGLTMTSSAFERNGAIPAQYTCDGANISPPLEWQHVPAKAAALVLFVIDDTSTGPASGIRWVVGDISPTAKGVAAGRTPEGGIVGSDTQGKSGYGGICPPHGKTGTIEFVLYALSKRIPLSPGFQPAVAESEYGAGKDLLGSAATTYAVYQRR